MVTVGGGDAGDCCQLVDGADTIRISWSGEHDDDDHVQVVLMSSRIEVNSTQQFSSYVLLITLCVTTCWVNCVHYKGAGLLSHVDAVGWI